VELETTKNMVRYSATNSIGISISLKLQTVIRTLTFLSTMVMYIKIPNPVASTITKDLVVIRTTLEIIVQSSGKYGG
jgi:hypothetical protein